MLRGATSWLEALAPVLPRPKRAGASDEALAGLAKTLDDMNLKQLKAHENGCINAKTFSELYSEPFAEAGVTDEIAKRLGCWTEDATARRYDHDGRLKELREAVEKGAGPVGGKKKPGGKKSD